MLSTARGSVGSLSDIQHFWMRVISSVSKCQVRHLALKAQFPLISPSHDTQEGRPPAQGFISARGPMDLYITVVRLSFSIGRIHALIAVIAGCKHGFNWIDSSLLFALCLSPLLMLWSRAKIQTVCLCYDSLLLPFASLKCEPPILPPSFRLSGIVAVALHGCMYVCVCGVCAFVCGFIHVSVHPCLSNKAFR